MALENLYLILHKVRGEPAFDIATPLRVGSEEWWIIPTSGHRAYPHQAWPMTNVWINRTFVASPGVSLPPELPDHYPANKNPIPLSAKPQARRALGVDALEDLLK